MEDCPVSSVDEIDDVSAVDEYKVALHAGLSEKEAIRIVNIYSRDNARTPMQWDETENAGFTSGKPWLHVNPNYKKAAPGRKAVNVASEEKDPDSILSYYKKLTSLRKDPEYADTIVYGAFEPFMESESRLMAFYRRGEKQTLLVLGNFRTEERTLKLPAKAGKVLINNLPDLKMDGENVTLQGYQAVVLDVTE